MWFLSSSSSRRRVLNSSMAVVMLVIIFVLQIWVCGDCCRAGAIRIFPENGTRKMVERKVYNTEDIQNYFNGTTTDKGFEESKRRVPSCPDPLHN
ncbi:CLAVATA3/ESR-RELATED 27 [Hibiscus trionum]|uniref:CLAVATA3/ESR-RELATED 27 n=1 Tax=Hibiscus trionum TaxID=183268 RepID=A0A9W7HDJ6_HIBTR|nr:CLAVATA3/ESR-RELATED 27 [Hibiscus trionum]